MASNVFMTGFPGFIGKRLVDRLLRKEPEAELTFLIQAKLRQLAEESLAAIDERHPGARARARLIAGDIAAPRLGMGEEEYRGEAARTTHVWHLAAIYDLAVPASVAYRVNVLGTAGVLDFCQACSNLKRLDYVSTCYVSGTRTGRILEAELDEGQGFKNHYESTKCWAELEVRRRMSALPVAIHRPAIVVGDSRSGDTDKYDGPYFVMKLLHRLPSWLPMVHIGEGAARVGFVPVDYLVDAMAEIWTKPEAIGLTAQIADPSPHSVREILSGVMRAFGFRKPLATVPVGLVQRALAVPALRSVLQMPEEALVYFDHEALYDTANTSRLLAGSGIRCPDFLEYLPTLVDYVRRYPDKPFIDGRSF
jgi:thioester reductase-like protein